jgi:glycosyltransferase involved in cell wall biosynthesis
MHDFSIIGFLDKTKGRKRTIFNYIVARAGGIVTVGKWETEELKRRFPHLADHIEYIPFGVDTNFFQPQNIPEERLVIAVGVDPDRDWKAFFAACEGLDAKIIVAGKQRGGVEALRPPANVAITFFEPKDMVSLYAKASAVVIPLDTRSGVNDAMGCSTLYEAMAMGRPMVVSRTHHMESYITDGENGLLVPQQDAKAMREAIDKLLTDEALRKKLGTNARAYALEHLEIMKCTEKLKRFFERLSV